MSQIPEKKELAELEAYYKKQLLELSQKSNFPPAQPLSEPASALSEQPEGKKETKPKSKQETKESKEQPLISEFAFSKPAPKPNFSRPGKSLPQMPNKTAKSGVLPGEKAVLHSTPVVSAQYQPSGRLQAKVTTASGAVPVGGATVIIEREIDGKTYFVQQLVTDRSGNTPLSEPLATIAASESQTPNSNGKPYTVYQVRIKAKGFKDYLAEQVFVFDGQVSLVEAELLPQREFRQED